MCAWINVAQHDLLFPALSARQHLRMYARIKGVGSKEEVTTEVERLLKEVGLDHVGDAPVSTFSGGMKRRCSIAVACIGDVKVLLLDEPTTGALSCPRFEAGFLLLLSTLVSRPCSTNSTLLLCISVRPNVIRAANNDVAGAALAVKLTNNFFADLVESRMEENP